MTLRLECFCLLPLCLKQKLIDGRGDTPSLNTIERSTILARKAYIEIIQYKPNQSRPFHSMKIYRVVKQYFILKDKYNRQGRKNLRQDRTGQDRI